MKNDARKDFWNAFEKSGNIAHYLLYKEVEKEDN